MLAVDPAETLKRLVLRPVDRPWRWPAGATPAAWERCAVETDDGAALAGLYGAAEAGPPTAAVLLVHPMDPRGKGYLLQRGHARFLREAGYDVFLVDLNGFGESDHASVDYPGDVRAAFAAMADRSPATRYGALGVSLGASTLFCALARADLPVDAAVFDSPYTTVEEFWTAYDPLRGALVRIGGALAPRRVAALNPLAWADSLTAPDRVLFVYGADDEYTPPAMGDRLVDRLSLPDAAVDRWTVPDGRHVRTYLADPDGYERRVTACFDAVFD
jgi:pimeloyl-ACP methyl ester carboxylesterase